MTRSHDELMNELLRTKGHLASARALLTRLSLELELDQDLSLEDQAEQAEELLDDQEDELD